MNYSPNSGMLKKKNLPSMGSGCFPKAERGCPPLDLPFKAHQLESSPQLFLNILLAKLVIEEVLDTRRLGNEYKYTFTCHWLCLFLCLASLWGKASYSLQTTESRRNTTLHPTAGNNSIISSNKQQKLATLQLQCCGDIFRKIIWHT